MKAMRLQTPGSGLTLEEISLPAPQEHQVLLQVLACGVCRTDLHLLDGELPAIPYPITPGHEIVARVVDTGRAVTKFEAGDRVGVPWLGHTCGVCRYCLEGAENLCEQAQFTGYTIDGGYSQYALADARYCLALPQKYSALPGRPAALRRSDWVPRLSRCGQRDQPRSVRIRRRRASAGTGCACRRASSVRFDTPRRQRVSAVRAKSRRSLGGWVR